MASKTYFCQLISLVPTSRVRWDTWDPFTTLVWLLLFAIFFTLIRF